MYWWLTTLALVPVLREVVALFRDRYRYRAMDGYLRSARPGSRLAQRDARSSTELIVGTVPNTDPTELSQS